MIGASNQELATRSTDAVAELLFPSRYLLVAKTGGLRG
jgi:hypothetical protein